ncbi:MAG: hypothetical protein EBR34_15510 [Sphingomonadaceae bacterium]|nr:hypothetical protein [Sphingomonadaceae bacterium]
MTPKQQAQQIEKDIKEMKFQMDTFRYRQIARYSINLLKRELHEVEKVTRVNMTEMIRYWDEVLNNLP